MKNVTIVMPIRDAETILPSLRAQVEALDYPQDNLRIVFVEGDSQDNTWGQLTQWYQESGYLNFINLVKFDTGSIKHPSTVSPERFTHLARVFNKCITSANLDWSDYVIFSPSDVIFDSDVIKRLLASGKDFIAPFFWIGERDNCRFYDIWGFKQDGKKFPPSGWGWYHTRYAGRPYLEMDYIGGMILMNADIIRRGARYGDEKVDHNLCDDARQLGYTIWADSTTHIYHR